MRTLKEILLNTDADEIIEAYNYKHSPQLWELDSEKSVSSVKEGLNNKLRDFIEKLKSMEETPGECRGILYCRKILDEKLLLTEPETELVFADDLLKCNGDYTQISHYAFEFTKQSEVLSFYVSDSEFTNRHLSDLVADCLFEMSFFGFDQEGLEEEKEKLEKAEKDIKEHPERCKPIEDLYEKFGFPRPVRYEKEKEYHDSVLKEAVRFHQYCDSVELDFIVEDLKKRERRTG